MPACGRKVAGRWGISVAHVVIFENFCKLSLLSDQIGESELVPVTVSARRPEQVRGVRISFYM